MSIKNKGKVQDRIKIAAILVAPCLVFGAGYWLGQYKHSEVKVEQQARIVYQDRVIVRSEAREEAKVRESVIVKPDGTKITTKTTSQTADKKAEGEQTQGVVSESRISASESKPVPNASTNSSIGLSLKGLNYNDPGKYSLYGAKRIVGNLWGQGTVDIKGNVTLGLRLDF